MKQQKTRRAKPVTIPAKLLRTSLTDRPEPDGAFLVGLPSPLRKLMLQLFAGRRRHQKWESEMGDKIARAYLLKPDGSAPSKRRQISRR